jgi:hypothetical protein
MMMSSQISTISYDDERPGAKTGRGQFMFAVAPTSLSPDVFTGSGRFSAI